MKNKVLEIGKGHARVIQKPMPSPKSNFVLVKQHIAPNCIEHRIFDTGFREFHECAQPAQLGTHAEVNHTDPCLHAGHEGVGEVVELGPQATKWNIGDRVVIFQGWPCGDCYVCEQGLSPTHCINLRIPADIEAYNDAESGGNGFCEYRLVPEGMLAKIPDNLSYRHAASANCLIGCTYSPVRDLNITAEHTCLVGGVGFVGLATIINLKFRGAKVIVLGRDERRMRAAKSLFEADVVINPEDKDWIEQIRAHTPDSRGVDFAFECSGYPFYQQKCLDALRHYGHLVLLGYAAQEGENFTWNLNTERGLSWGHKTISSHFDVNVNHRSDILLALQDPWMQAQIDKLVTHTIPMSRAEDAFKLLAKRVESDEFIGKIHFLPGE